MVSGQVEHLLKMANQIALNLAAWGDEQAVAAKTAEHMEKFWTRAMREQLLEFRRAGGEGISPSVLRVLDSFEGEGQTSGSVL